MRQDYQRGLRWVLKCLLEIVYGMEYLHSIGVVHGDLKCANVMCSSKMTDMRGFVCKIADFGLARTSEGFTDMHSSSPGTALFAAPERLSSGSLGSHSDVYSFGMLAWHLVSMGSLAADLEEYQVRYQVVERGWRPPFPHQTPEFMQVSLSAFKADQGRHSSCPHHQHLGQSCTCLALCSMR
jgi:serine/threonine protein kinase